MIKVARVLEPIGYFENVCRATYETSIKTRGIGNDLTYTRYSKIAAILAFFCLLAN